MKKYKTQIVLFLLLSFGTLLVFLPSFLKGNYYIGGGDVRTQSYEFYMLYKREIINALRNRTLPFWSWIVFLGNNIWCSKLFYGLFDIFNIVTYWMPFNYYVVYAVQCWMKVIVAGISFYYLLKYRFGNDKTAFAGALCYGLSSYAIYFFSSPNLLTPFALMPLYFLGMEKYLKERKVILYIVISTILFYAQFYTFYAITLFSPIYFIYRYYNINKKLKGFLKEALPLIGAYLIAFMLAAVVLIPEIFFITQNERVGAFDSRLLFDDITVPLHLLIASFVPTQNYIYDANVFDQGAHALKELCMFSSSLTALLFTQFLGSKDRYYRNSTIILYVLIACLVLTPVGNSMMVGFSEVNFRWMLIVIMMNVLTASEALTVNRKADKRVLFWTVISETVIVVASFTAALVTKDAGVANYMKQTVIFAVTIVIMWLSYLFVVKSKKQAAVILMTGQLLIACLVSGIGGKALSESKESIDAVSNVLIDNYDYHNLKDYLDSLDEENSSIFYRVYVSYQSLYWDYSHNFNIIYNLQGLTTYDSAYQPSFNYMRNKFYYEVVGRIPWELEISDSNLLDFYNTKYSITSNVEEIPFNEYRIIDDTYQGSFVIAENLNYQSIGKTYSDVISFDELETEFETDTEILKKYVITYSKDEVADCIKSENSSEMFDVTYSTNKLSGTIECDNDSFMVIGVPYDEGWAVKVNGKKVETYLIGGGVTGIPVYKGTNNIEMCFVPKGFKTGLAMTALGFVLFIALLIVVRRKRAKSS